MNVSNDGDISSVSCNMDVPTNYSNTLQRNSLVHLQIL